MYEKIVKRLKEKTERFNYDGWVDTAVILEEDADAIEELQNKYDTVTSVQKHVIENLRNDLDFAVRADAAAVKACTPRWIPVTERLPEVWIDVLCSVNGERHYCAVGAIDNHGDWHVDDDYEESSTFHVTHWMPLPEPPETKGETE